MSVQSEVAPAEVVKISETAALKSLIQTIRGQLAIWSEQYKTKQEHDPLRQLRTELRLVEDGDSAHEIRVSLVGFFNKLGAVTPQPEDLQAKLTEWGDDLNTIVNQYVSGLEKSSH